MPVAAALQAAAYLVARPAGAIAPTRGPCGPCCEAGGAFTRAHHESRWACAWDSPGTVAETLRSKTKEISKISSTACSTKEDD
jgi:hypothetical protein